MTSVTERLDLFYDTPGRALPSLRIAAPLAAGYCLLIALWHAVMQPPNLRLPLTLAALLIASALIVISHLARRRSPLAVRHASSMLLFVPVAAVLNAGLHLWLVPDPWLTTNLLLAVVLSGLLLRHGAALLTVQLLAAIAFLVPAALNPIDGWWHFAFSLIITSALSVIVFSIRAHNARELNRLGDLEFAQRRSLEEAADNARRSETRYRALVDRCPDAIFTVQRGVVLYANPAAETLLDANSGGLVGRSVAELSADERGRSLGDDVASLTLLDLNGSRVGVSCTVVTVPVDESPLLLVFARDERSRLAADELHAEFLSTVSHELRTPLTSIAGALRLLLDPRLERSPRDANLLELASRNSDRLGHLIEDLLDLRRLEAGALRTVTEPVWLREPVEAAVAPFLNTTTEVRLTLLADIQCEGDREALTRAVRHLLLNAQKFGPRRGPIDITIRAEGREGFIDVSDRGPGIPRRHRDQATERFKQVESGLSRPHGGFGVGLTIARGIVEEHGGSLLLHNREGGGAMVSLCLPLRSA